MENSQTLEGALAETERQTGRRRGFREEVFRGVHSAQKASSQGDLGGMRKALAEAPEEGPQNDTPGCRGSPLTVPRVQ